MNEAEKLDHRPLGKGKYSQSTASDVAERDPSYLVWAYETWTDKPCSELLYKECKSEVATNGHHNRVGRDQGF